MTTTSTRKRNRAQAEHGVVPPATHPGTAAVGAGLHRLASAHPFGALQAKLTIGPANDRFEAEANRVADEVMRAQDAAVESRLHGPQPISQRSDAPLRRQPLEEEEEELLLMRDGSGNGETCIQRQEEEEEEEALQASAHCAPAVVPAHRVDALVTDARHGPGQPLPRSLRDFMEPRFGADFGDVRLHSGHSADKAARAINARAFTVGHDIVLARGEGATNSPQGRRLLAHELTHTIQQNAAPLTANATPRQTRQRHAGRAANMAGNQSVRVTASVTTPAIQLLRLTGGGFGRALEEYTDIHSIQDNVVRLLARSRIFMRMAQALDREYVWRTDSFNWEQGHHLRALQYDARNRITNGPPSIRGKRELMVVGGGSGASFMPFESPANPLSSDIIVLNPTSSEEFLRTVAHEAAHARNHVGHSGPTPATLAASVTAGIQEEIDVRTIEQDVVGQIAPAASRLSITFGPGPSTVPAEVEREFSPGLGLTYLENIFFSWQLRDAQTSEGLSDDEATDIRTRVDARMPAAPFILGNSPSASSGLYELSQYAETYFNYKTAMHDWAQLRQRVRPDSPSFAAAEERMRRAHARRFFGGRIAYRALPAAATPASSTP